MKIAIIGGTGRMGRGLGGQLAKSHEVIIGSRDSARAKAAAAALIQPVIAREVPKIAGIKTRTVWKYRIVDAAQIPREYMIPNEVMLGNVARSTKGAVKVAGVEFYSEDSSI